MRGRPGHHRLHAQLGHAGPSRYRRSSCSSAACCTSSCVRPPSPTRRPACSTPSPGSGRRSSGSAGPGVPAGPPWSCPWTSTISSGSTTPMGIWPGTSCSPRRPARWASTCGPAMCWAGSGRRGVRGRAARGRAAGGVPHRRAAAGPGRGHRGGGPRRRRSRRHRFSGRRRSRRHSFRLYRDRHGLDRGGCAGPATARPASSRSPRPTPRCTGRRSRAGTGCARSPRGGAVRPAALKPLTLGHA